MRRRHVFFPATVIVAIFIVAGSCSDDKGSSRGEGPGMLVLDIRIMMPQEAATAHSNAAGAKFSLDIFMKDGDMPVMTLGSLALTDNPLPLDEGEYYAVVIYGVNPTAAFGQPFYSGRSAMFEISGGSTTYASVTCTLANVMVSVDYSDEAIRRFDTLSTEVDNGRGKLLFEVASFDAGYFDKGPLVITCRVTSTDGNTKTAAHNVDIQPGMRCHIHVDAEVNGEDVMVSVNSYKDAGTVITYISDGGLTTPGYDGGSGELLITEIMYNSKALADSSGEWFEVLNVSTSQINMKGMVIKRGASASFHRVADDVILPPGGCVVFGRTADATDNVSYVYSSLNLGNNGDEIIIRRYGTNGADGKLICSVDYGKEGFNTRLDGASLQLDPKVRDVESARIGANWCAATTAYNTGDLGTPGQPNYPCGGY